MRFKSTPELDAKRNKLSQYLVTLPNGAEVLWEELERETSIPMTPEGKSLVRNILYAEKREYESMWGVGIRLSSVENSARIVGQRVGKFVRAVDKTKLASDNVLQRHGEEMDDRTLKGLIRVNSVMGAIRTAAGDARDATREIAMPNRPILPASMKAGK